MNRSHRVLSVFPRVFLAPLLLGGQGVWLLGGFWLPAAEVVEVGPAAHASGTPRWDAGTGPAGLAGNRGGLDMSDDGRFLAVGTIAPAGDPNLFLLDAEGRLVRQHRAGHRWVNEVTRVPRRPLRRRPVHHARRHRG